MLFKIVLSIVKVNSYLKTHLHRLIPSFTETVTQSVKVNESQYLPISTYLARFLILQTGSANL